MAPFKSLNLSRGVRTIFWIHPGETLCCIIDVHMPELGGGRVEGVCFALGCIMRVLHLWVEKLWFLWKIYVFKKSGKFGRSHVMWNSMKIFVLGAFSWRSTLNTATSYLSPFVTTVTSLLDRGAQGGWRSNGQSRFRLCWMDISKLCLLHALCKHGGKLGSNFG